MTSAPDRAQAITAAVHRYIELLNSGGADDFAALYADDATLEDPVGGEVHIGRQAIRNFYAAIENLDRAAELVTIRVAGHEAAFAFSLVITNGDHRMRIEPIDVMVFDGDGKIAGMKAYWSAANITQL
ncbi:nuclear transport factor 2 family protein [Mycobacterium sp. M1]|uniref:Nuclear transport factor 2 family protein n=1 Tax=Mycolicibacter acidiphilus TaxID=2835306 RepID=A0ABS5RKA0_9MYCO|nr:nuclear transport factor 2 family protein [Mycolicibacter acidiphilus]MBS9534665.1 nuclear transport factor 2 family protein [Mycolicibacter acidiphilus]